MDGLPVGKEHHPQPAVSTVRDPTPPSDATVGLSRLVLRRGSDMEDPLDPNRAPIRAPAGVCEVLRESKVRRHRPACCRHNRPLPMLWRKRRPSANLPLSMAR